MESRFPAIGLETRLVAAVSKGGGIMERYPKQIKRQIRELAGHAYKNELKRELGKLGLHFDEWREGKISAGELTELVHQYHNGPARELWKKYNQNPFTELLVASAMVRGILQKEDVSEEVWPYITETIERSGFDWGEGDLLGAEGDGNGDYSRRSDSRDTGIG